MLLATTPTHSYTKRLYFCLPSCNSLGGSGSEGKIGIDSTTTKTRSSIYLCCSCLVVGIIIINKKNTVVNIINNNINN